MLKDDQYAAKDVTIIKEINKKCNLNLTHGRMSTTKINKCYLLYCNTPTQFEHLLKKQTDLIKYVIVIILSIYLKKFLRPIRLLC
jgi:hypothetical protein